MNPHNSQPAETSAPSLAPTMSSPSTSLAQVPHQQAESTASVPALPATAAEQRPSIKSGICPATKPSNNPIVQHKDFSTLPHPRPGHTFRWRPRPEDISSLPKPPPDHKFPFRPKFIDDILRKVDVPAHNEKPKANMSSEPDARVDTDKVEPPCIKGYKGEKPFTEYEHWTTQGDSSRKAYTRATLNAFRLNSEIIDLWSGVAESMEVLGLEEESAVVYKYLTNSIDVVVNLDFIVGGLKHDLERIDCEVRRLRYENKEMLEFKRKLKRRERSLVELQVRNRDLLDKLSSLDQLIEQLDTSEKQKLKLHEEIEGLKAANQETEDFWIQKCQKHGDVSERQILKLQEAVNLLKTVEKENSVLKEEAKKSNNKAEALKKEIEKYGKLEEQLLQMAVILDDNQLLRKQMKELQEDNNAVKESNDNLLHEVLEIKAASLELQHRLDQSTRDIEKSNSKHCMEKEIEQELARLVSNNTSLLDELAKSKASDSQSPFQATRKNESLNSNLESFKSLLEVGEQVVLRDSPSNTEVLNVLTNDIKEDGLNRVNESGNEAAGYSANSAHEEVTVPGSSHNSRHKKKQRNKRRNAKGDLGDHNLRRKYNPPRPDSQCITSANTNTSDGNIELISNEQVPILSQPLVSVPEDNTEFEEHPATSGQALNTIDLPQLIDTEPVTLPDLQNTDRLSDSAIYVQLSASYPRGIIDFLKVFILFLLFITLGVYFVMPMPHQSQLPFSFNDVSQSLVMARYEARYLIWSQLDNFSPCNNVGCMLPG